MQPTLLSTPNRPSTSKSVSQQDTSRSFMTMTPSMFSTNKYPKCQSKKQHNKQLLNLICLTQNCKARGPICALCKSSEHATHMVIPMKKFLGNVQECIKQKKNQNQVEISMKKQQKLKTQKQQQISVNIFEQPSQFNSTNLKQKQQQMQQKLTQFDLLDRKIQQIITSKQRMLYNLSKQINSLAQHIRKIQQKIINDTQQALQSAKNAANMEMNIKRLINQLQQQKQGQAIDSQIYRAKVKNLLSMIKCKTKDNCQINSEGINKICSDFFNNSQSFMLNLQNWSEQCQKTLNKVFEYNPNIKKTIQQKNGQKKPAENPADVYRFSPQLKIKSIHLSNQNKVAKQSQKISGVALMTGPLLKQKKIKIKILNLSNSIIIGVGFKDILKQSQYKINTSNIGHGVYGIGNNSYTYSHHNKGNNMVMKGLAFGTGDQVTLTFKGQVIIFSKKTDLKTISLQLKKMTEEDWKQLVICVFLASVGDKVQILQ